MKRFLTLAAVALFGLAVSGLAALAGERGEGGGAARPGGGGGRGGGGGGEEKEDGTVYVLEDSDRVILRDGTEIKGTILCAGQAAVTILTPDGEETIPRERIERIVKNLDGSFPKKFKAEETDGHLFLVEAPPDPPPGEGDDEGGGAPKARPKAAPKARPKAAPKAPAKGKPAAPAGRTPAARPARPTQPTLPGLPNGLPNLKDLNDPRIQDLLKRLPKGVDPQDLLKDPRVLQRLQDAMKKR